jgi:DNA-directed RNA polymerase specialized sigma24 family protein
MNKSEILDELYKSDRVIKVLAKLPPEIVDDLKQEVFMLLLLKPEVEIIDLYKRGTLYSYFAKILFNQINWERSQFNILYNTYQFKEVKGLPQDKIMPGPMDRHDSWGDNWDMKFNIEEQEPEPDFTEEIERAVDNLHPYNKQLLRWYAEFGTYRAVGDHSGIAWKSVYNAVAKAREAISKEVNLKILK